MNGTPPGPDDAELFGPLERSGAARGWLHVIVAVVLGALLMPSATRPSLAPAAPAAVSSASGGGTAASTTTTVPPATTTTTAAATTTTAPRATAPASIPASQIRVLVANGTNTNGAAAAVTSFLSGKGFSMLKAANALTTVAATQIYPIKAAVTAAEEVAAALGLSSSAVQPNSTPVPVPSTAGATVVVVVGPDILPRSSSTSSGA